MLQLFGKLISLKASLAVSELFISHTSEKEQVTNVMFNIDLYLYIHACIS